MNVVLDTNVLVSGLLSPFSPSGEIVRMVAAGGVRLCVDARLLTEYSEVLHRPKFGFDLDMVESFLDYVSRSGVVVSGVPLRTALPDRDDEPFLEAAVAGEAKCLVTGNAKHFPAKCRQGVVVLSPSKFLEYYRERKARG